MKRAKKDAGSNRPKRGRKAETAAEGRGWALFDAEAAYGESIFRFGIRDVRGAIEAAERCVAALPSYAPGLLTLGSIEYQRRRPARGRELFERLLSLPRSTKDLAEILDRAGDFLIDRRRYREALEAARRAASLSPDDARCANDYGWSLFRAGRADEARRELERAVALDPTDDHASGSLAFVERALRKRRRKPRPRRKRTDRVSETGTLFPPEARPSEGSSKSSGGGRAPPIASGA